MSGFVLAGVRRARLALVALGAALGVGCVSVDESAWWGADWDAAMGRAERDAPALELPGVGAEDELGVERLAAEADGAGRWPVSLELAVGMALERNRDLEVQRFGPVIAGTFERLERGAFDAEAFGGLTYAEETASEIDRGTGGQFAVESRDALLELGVRQTLPTGTAVEMTAGQARDTSNRAPEQQDARLGISVTQQLLRGFGPAVNFARVRQAGLGARASAFELRGFAEALVAEVESTYWLAVLAWEEVSIVERSLAFARRELDEIEQRIELGALAGSAAAVARVEVSRREQALIDAQSRYEAERMALLRLLNPPGDRPLGWALSLSSGLAAERLALDDVSDRVRLAVRGRPDLAEARLRLEQDRLETVVTRNGLLPRLEVFMALGKTGFDSRFDDSFRNLDGETYDLQAGLAFSKPIGNDAAEARNRAAFATRGRSAAAVKNLEQAVRLEVRLAANELDRAWAQIEASRTTRALQEQVVGAERERLDAGTSTALLVAQAERELLDSEIEEVRSLVAYRLAVLELYVAEGSLLDRRGLGVAE